MFFFRTKFAQTQRMYMEIVAKSAKFAKLMRIDAYKML